MIVPPPLRLLALTGVMALGACGGDDKPAAPVPTTVPAAPGAGIDPNADGVITGPINRARNTADDARRRNEQVEQQTATTAS